MTWLHQLLKRATRNAPQPRYYAATRQESLASAVKRINTTRDLRKYVAETTPAERELHSAIAHGVLAVPYRAKSGRVYG